MFGGMPHQAMRLPPNVQVLQHCFQAPASCSASYSSRGTSSGAWAGQATAGQDRMVTLV